MEKKITDLESEVQNQKKQIARYESRLKDVVTAYKGLLKEKEALEAVISTPSSDAGQSNNAAQKAPPTTAANTSASTSSSPDSTAAELRSQIATMMNSLATLSAEKSRMEASFQADKRQLRSELQQRDQLVRDAAERAKEAARARALELEQVKSKLIVERHARDKETSDHMAMVRELQQLLADERQLRSQMQMQLHDVREQKFAAGEKLEQAAAEEKKTAELARMTEKRRDQAGKSDSSDSAAEDRPNANNQQLMQTLHRDMEALKHQTQKTVQLEQRRAQQAEERSKRAASVAEERVAQLEARLADLSETVGTYDRLRQSDQEQIFQLKERIAQLDGAAAVEGKGTFIEERNADVSSGLADAATDIDELMREVQHLKSRLIVENARQMQPRDLSKLFASPSSDDHQHVECRERAEQMAAELERWRREAPALAANVETQRQHIRTLQDKVQVLNRNLDEQEQELKEKGQAHGAEMRAERTKWRELVAAMEVDFRGKVSELELQLQKQRDRSLRLLEEKESELKKIRQQAFDASETDPSAHGAAASSIDDDAGHPSSSAGRRKISSSSTPATDASSSTAESHLLHYVHEMSRKEVEIAALRKAKTAAEAAERQAVQDKVATQQDLCERIDDLEANVDRLERCKSREGANLEYLKNVVLSFLVAADAESRRHMVNAIGAVLQFNPSELQTIGVYLAARK